MKTPDEFRNPTVQNKHVNAPKTTSKDRGLCVSVAFEQKAAIDVRILEG